MARETESTQTGERRRADGLSGAGSGSVSAKGVDTSVGEGRPKKRDCSGLRDTRQPGQGVVLDVRGRLEQPLP